MMSFAAHMPLNYGQLRRGVKGTRQLGDYAGPIRSLAEADGNDAVEANCDWIVQLSGDIGNAIIYASEKVDGDKPEEFDNEAFAYIRNSTTAIIRNYRDMKKKSHVESYEKWDYVMAELFCSLLKNKSKDWQTSVNFIYDYFKYINHDRIYTGFLRNIVKILKGEVGATPIRIFINNLNECFNIVKMVEESFTQYFAENKWEYVSKNTHTQKNMEIFGLTKEQYRELGFAGGSISDFIRTFGSFSAFTIQDSKIMGNCKTDKHSMVMNILLDHYINKYKHIGGFKMCLQALDNVVLLMTNKEGATEVPYKTILFDLIDLRRVELQDKIRIQEEKKRIF